MEGTEQKQTLTLQDVVDMALKIGIPPEERQTWIDNQLKQHRDRERDDRAERRAREEEIRQQIESDKRKQEEADEKVRQRMESDKAKERKHESELADKQRKHEMEIADKRLKILEMETEKLKQEAAAAAARGDWSPEDRRKFEENQKQKDREHQLELERIKNDAIVRAEQEKAAAVIKTKELEIQSKEDIEHQRREVRKEQHKHIKYKNVIRCFTKDDNFPAWLKNMERCLREDEIPEEDWAYILKKSLSGEPQRLIENLSERNTGDYQFIKDKLMAHFKCDAAGYRDRFHSLQPKSNQTFFDYLTEIEATLDSWFDMEEIHRDFDRVHQVLIKDKILSSVPTPMAKFLKEQRIKDIKDLEEKGTAYYNANCEVFAMGIQPDLAIGAAATWAKGKTGKQSNDISTKFPPTKKWDKDSNKETKRKYCSRTHNIKYLCDASPEGKAYLKKHIRYAAERRRQCAFEGRCFCCKIVFHKANECPCKERKQYLNAVQKSSDSDEPLTTRYMRRYMHSLGLDSDSEGESYYPSSGEDEWLANAADMVQSESIFPCKNCKIFHASGTLPCGHSVHIENKANAANAAEGNLKLYPGRINGKRIKILLDTGTTVNGIHKDLISEKDLIGQKVTCRRFGGTTETYSLASIEIDSVVRKGKIRAAILENPCTDLILSHVHNVEEITENEIQQWIEEDKKRYANAMTKNGTETLENEAQKENLQMIKPMPVDIKVQDIETKRKVDSLKEVYEFKEKKSKTSPNRKWKFTCNIGMIILFCIFLSPILLSNWDTTQNSIVMLPLQERDYTNFIVLTTINKESLMERMIIVNREIKGELLIQIKGKMKMYHSKWMKTFLINTSPIRTKEMDNLKRKVTTTKTLRKRHSLRKKMLYFRYRQRIKLKSPNDKILLILLGKSNRSFKSLSKPKLGSIIQK